MIDEQDFMEEIRVEQFAAAPMNDSAYDSAESIAPDSDFDDEQIRKMLAHHCTCGTERKVMDKVKLITLKNLMTQSSWNPRFSRKFDAIYVQKRQANAKRHQTCHSGRGKLDDRFVSREWSFRET